MATPRPRIPSVRERELARRLRHLRESRGLELAPVARHLGVSVSTLSRLERGQRSLTTPYVTTLCHIYGLDGRTTDEYVNAFLDAQGKIWWQEYDKLEEDTERYLSLEAEASSIKDFGFFVVPGLLQTRRYADAVLRSVRKDFSDEQLSETVEARLARRRVLSGEDPAQFHGVMDEAILHREFCGRAAMLEQLKLLREMLALPNITIQILPLSAVANPGLDGPFVLFDFAGRRQPSTVYTEEQLGQHFWEQ